MNHDGLLLRILAWGREGHFPRGGGLLDQTSWFVNALEIYAAEANEMEAWARDVERTRRTRDV